MNTLADLLAQTPPRAEEKRFVDKSLQLSGLIWAAMQRKGLTQKALADLLNKQESEVCRWLSGLHNFTLKTLTRIEAVLDEDLVLVFRDNQPQATSSRTTQRILSLPADRWEAAPFQTVTVNPGKTATTTPAADPARFTLRAA